MNNYRREKFIMSELRRDLEQLADAMEAELAERYQLAEGLLQDLAQIAHDTDRKNRIIRAGAVTASIRRRVFGPLDKRDPINATLNSIFNNVKKSV